LGEFKVASATDTTVTLTYTIPLDGNLASKVMASDGAWSLYEQMPADSHYAFSEGKPDPGAPSLFGAMDEAQLRKLLPRNRFKLLDDGEYEALIARYLRDGHEAPEEVREREPENVWVRVTFLKQHEVDVDAPKGQAADTDFDDLGRAKLESLRRGKAGDAEKVVFEPNDDGLFEYAEAQRLIDAGVCKLKEEAPYIFVRPLNDYAYAYRENFRRRMQLAEDIDTVTRNTKLIAEADAKANQQIDSRQKERDSLEEDLGKFQTELERVTQYAGTLDRRWAEVRGELSDLYLLNLMLVEKLAAVQRRMADEIDRRSNTAAN
jgi:hypothetical protein